MVNSTYRCWKVIEVYFESETVISREKQLVPYSWQCLCVFCHSNEALPGESWYDGDQPLAYSPNLVLADFFLFPKVETVFRKKI
jgi:hypothetical protein